MLTPLFFPFLAESEVSLLLHSIVLLSANYPTALSRHWQEAWRNVLWWLCSLSCTGKHNFLRAVNVSFLPRRKHFKAVLGKKKNYLSPKLKACLQWRKRSHYSRRLKTVLFADLSSSVNMDEYRQQHSIWQNWANPLRLSGERCGIPLSKLAWDRYIFT